MTGAGEGSTTEETGLVDPSTCSIAPTVGCAVVGAKATARLAAIAVNVPVASIYIYTCPSGGTLLIRHFGEMCHMR